MSAAHNTAYHNSGYDRSNSMTSVTSFTSYASSSMRQTHQHVPRGSSTNDLLTMESKFTKPSRTRLGLKHSSSTASLVSSSSAQVQRYNMMSGETAQNRMPRSNSMQPGRMPELYANSFRGSASLTNIPQYKRRPVENAHSNHVKNQFYEQKKVQQQQQQQQQSQFQLGAPLQPRSRRNQHMPKVPFTFPNGEVYTPRDKQRNSYTNLKSLSSDLNSYNQSAQPPPRSPRRPRPASAPVKAQADVYVSQDISHSATNSFSSSPSPSRASRTNSSVNDSTPPSSIDDLTIQITHSGNTEVKVFGEHYAMSGSTSNLGKIDEVSKPEECEILPVDEGSTNTAIGEPQQIREKTSSQPVQSIVKTPPQSLTLTHTPRTVPEPIPQLQAQLQAHPQAHSQAQPPQQPGTKSSAQSKPPSIQESMLVSKAKNSASSPQKKLVEKMAEKKPSAIKRFFSKVFSGKKPKESKSSRASSMKVAPMKKATKQTVKSQVKLPVEEPLTKPAGHPLQREVSTSSDVFSFVDGEEKINVRDLCNIKLDEPDFSEHKSELALDTLFSQLSANASKEKILDNLSLKDGKLEVKKLREKTEDVGEATVDSEDIVITFDDMEFIEKMIDFGETSFPDLNASDLGQSQRKLMRSKSIERKRSVRSVSSSSMLSKIEANSGTEIPGIPSVDQVMPQNARVIYTNQIREPLKMMAPRPSILKKKSNIVSSSLPSKKVGFRNVIYVNNTHPSYVYNRHSVALSSYQLSPQLIQQIRQDLNEFKRNMVVHEASLANTHFFRS